MTKSLLIAILLLISISLRAQDNLTFKKTDNLVSAAAYNKMVSENFSYLLLSENSPQQGISATLNDKGSNLKVNGLLYNGGYGVVTLEADLGSKNGVYFFDEEKGGQQAKVSFNYYRSLLSLSKYSPPKMLKASVKRTAILQLLTEAKGKHDKYLLLLNSILNGLQNFEDLKKDLKDSHRKIYKELQNLTAIYINDQKVQGFEALPEYEPELKEFLITKPESISFEDGDEIQTLISTNYSFNKLLAAYSQNETYITNELESKLIDLELKAAESQWTSKHNTFIGISPFYERESFRRFTFDPSLTFSKMFADTKGDLYGITFSLNYNYERKKISKYNILPYRFFIKASTTARRASNSSSFSNSTLNFTQSLGTDVDGNPIVFTKEDAAFIGDNHYEYGTSNLLQVEAYYYPTDFPVALFGRFGYEYINFSRLKDVKDKELSPMRLGVLFNLKDKKKDNPLVTIQLFLDRTDLSLSPNGKDNDLRFGLGIGLPINIK